MDANPPRKAPAKAATTIPEPSPHGSRAAAFAVAPGKIEAVQLETLAAVPHRLLVGAGVKTDVIDGVRVGLEVKNLLDRRIEDVPLDPPPRLARGTREILVVVDRWTWRAGEAARLAESVVH